MSTTGSRTPTSVRGLAARASIFAVAILFSRVASFLLLPVYTRFLTPADYGVIDLLDLTMSLCGILLAAPLTAPMYYLYSRPENADRQREIVRTAILGTSVMGLGCSVAIVASADLLSQLVYQSSAYTPLIRLAGVSLGFNLTMDIGLSWFRIADRAVHMTLWSMARTVVQIAFAISALVLFDGQLLPLVAAGTMSSGLMAAAMIFYCTRENGFRLDRDLFAQLWRRSLPGIVTAASQYFINFSSRFLMQRVADLTAVGLFALAYKFGSTVAIIHSAIHSAWVAQVYYLDQQEDRARLMNRIFLLFLAVMTAIVLGISLLAKPVIRVMANASYADAWQLVPLLAFGFLLRAVQDFLRAILYARDQLKTDAQVNVVSAVIAAGSLWALVTPLGATGAALSFVVTQLAGNAMVVRYLRRSDSCPALRAPVLIFAAGLAGTMPLYLRMADTLAGDLAVATVGLALYAGIVLAVAPAVRQEAWQLGTRLLARRSRQQ